MLHTFCVKTNVCEVNSRQIVAFRTFLFRSLYVSVDNSVTVLQSRNCGAVLMVSVAPKLHNRLDLDDAVIRGPRTIQ